VKAFGPLTKPLRHWVGSVDSREAQAVLEWIDRDRGEFEQVIMLAELEIGHAERFERVARETFDKRFQREPECSRQDRVTDRVEAVV
jgi:hypothetical protein